MKSVTIAIASCKRPRMLHSALESLVGLKLPENYVVRCVICDNDEQRSAEEVFKVFRSRLPFVLQYCHEANRGIVYTRNRLIEESEKVNSSLIAFFDDDARVEADWLVLLIDAMEKFEAECVVGSVKYHLPPKSPNWLKKRDFYGKIRPKTGTRVRVAGAGNALIDLAFLKKYRLKFDHRFNLTGGEDSFLFKMLRSHGGKMISCKEAFVHEEVPISRTTEEWILKRAYQNAHNEIRQTFFQKGIFAAFSILVGYGSWLMVCNLFAHLLYPVSDYSYKVFNRRRPRKVKGMLSALRGRNNEVYRVIHGD